MLQEITGTAFAVRKKEGFDNTLRCSYWRFFYILVCFNKVRSLSAKYRPDRYKRDKSVKFGTEIPWHLPINTGGGARYKRS